MNEVINQYFDWDAARPYFPDLARGFWVTLQIAFLAELLALGLGMVLAVARHVDHVAHRQHAHEGHVLCQGDEVVHQRRQHPADGLRQHHQAHGLAGAHAEAARRLGLPVAHQYARVEQPCARTVAGEKSLIAAPRQRQ